MTEVTIRFARADELTAINEIRRQVNDVHVSGRPDIFRTGFCRELNDRIYEIFDEPDCAIIVAVSDDRVIGFAAVRYTLKPLSPYNNERKIYQVEEFGVDEKYRRRGVARAMVDFMKKDAREKEYPRIELDMWEFNESALEFYNAVGFVTYRRYMELNIDGYPTRENAEKPEIGE